MTPQLLTQEMGEGLGPLAGAVEKGASASTPRATRGLTGSQLSRSPP